jgi:PAS domain S-box-containing protein
VSPGGQPRVNILAVDDHQENLVALEAILQRADYHVVKARSGQEALRLALREPFAVILLDVIMPGMDGFEVAEHLKQLDRTREIPILFLTARATDIEHIYRAYASGAVDYMIKPLDPEVVRRKVAVFVDLVQQREQIQRQAEALREADRRTYELRLAELRLATDRRYRKLIEGIDHAIGWTTDRELRFTFVSRSATAILGYPERQFTEPGFWNQLLHPDERDEVLAVFRTAIAEGTERSIDHRVLAADGRAAWYHTAVSGSPGEAGLPAELHGISIDVSYLKDAEAAARHTARVREELLAIVAHDLRSPLSSIRSSGELLQRVTDRADAQRVRQTASTIIRSADHMDRLIGDLLDLALIQADRMTIAREVLRPCDLVRESLELFQPMAAQKDLRLRGDADEALAISGDHDRVLQVLSNLIANAIKFTVTGAIDVRVDRQGDMARFAVADTGTGMSDDDLAQIWDRFWQGGRREKGSLGLGLAIAKALVETHGGRIWAESKLGAGSTFYFTLPLASEQAVAQESGGGERGAGHAATPPG